MQRQEGDKERSANQIWRKSRWTLIGSKIETSTVHNAVNGVDIHDHQPQITPRQAQTTRSTIVKSRGVVGEGQKRVWNVQHGTSMPIDHTMASIKPN